ncbi:hypothetical protein M405DRAFT_845796 [Rhizopogon salebrosus TDB-379]|nr:hypothetical protein M405DRAFT_845796 [Rhizopogon salebrosus TDB-379]
MASLKASSKVSFICDMSPPTGNLAYIMMPDIANPGPISSSPPSEDSLQFLPSPPGIHDNDQSHPPTAVAPFPPPLRDSEAADMITLSPQPTPLIQGGDTPALPQRPPENDVDPRIASLHAMFPDFDDSLLLSVLQSVNGNHDQAIDTLLGMSDPDYISQPAPVPQEQREPTQTELDEQLARRLMLEEEQAAQHQWRAPQQGQGSQAYQPRRAATRGGGDDAGRYDNAAQGGNAPQRDTMADFQDGFNKIAETGKKTFSSIVSKVKAKMQEFDQGNGPSRQDTQPTWGQPSQPSWSGGQRQTNTSLQPQYQSTHHSSNPQYQESYYDPNPPDESGIYGSVYTGQSPPRPGGGNSNPSLVPNTTYITPNPATKPIPNSTSMTSNNSSTFIGSSTYTLPATGMDTSPPSKFAQQSIDAPRPPSTGAVKLGLLPKRPVSLLREQTPSQPSRRDDSDDELEYTENPFEERR